MWYNYEMFKRTNPNIDRELEGTGGEGTPEAPIKNEIASKALMVINGDAKSDGRARAKDVLEIAGGSDGTIEVAGVKDINSKEAKEKFAAAMKAVKQAFGNFLKIDLDKIYFQMLPGDQVGEALEGKILLDPIMLKHPALRLAHLIAHEAAHIDLDTKNEGFIETFVKNRWEAKYGTGSTEEVYGQEVAKFEEFARQYNENRDMEKGLAEICELYNAENYEGIYDGYEENWINGLSNESAREEAFENFRTVFPELKFKPGEAYESGVSDKSKWGSWTLIQPQEDVKSPQPDDNVVDMAKYKVKAAKKKLTG